MAKKYSLKFWIVFWTISAFFLVCFFIFSEIKNRGLSSLADNLPFSEEHRTLLYLVDYFLKNDNQEKTFLVLFQNNMELRPGGGFIGSFGILKIKNGNVKDLQVYDLSNFDANITAAIEPPYPIKETMRTNSWKMRDSNFSPDFSENAKMAEEFYRLGGGEEKLDGVVAITTDVLTSFLKITGPIQLPDYPGTYADKNAIIALEYQVEKAYADQGIEKENRKSIMDELAEEIISKVFQFKIKDKIKLAQIILEDLKNKDIQIYFKDPKIQNQLEKTDWSGIVDKNWQDDFLMIVDANLGSYKSDYYVKRSVEYFVNFSGGMPEAVLKITYNHTAEQKDWMTKDYQTYLRVYVPEEAWFVSGNNFDNPQFGKEFGKKYFGSLIKVPLGTSKTIEVRYFLPAEFKNKPYNLKIEKQSGVKDVFYNVNIIKNEFEKKTQNFILGSDVVFKNL